MNKVAIMFPYGGYDDGSQRCILFWELIDTCNKVFRNQSHLVVINKDTINKGKADAFRNHPRTKAKEEFEVFEVWAVDTCQMWLSGWGYLLDKSIQEGISRIVLLPGDVDAVGDGSEKVKFFNLLKEFILLGDPYDIIIGDFTTKGRFEAKDLIDKYGTYALMANWFPEIAQKTLMLPLNHPRSEFLNIKVDVLHSLLSYRKFAYEQTVNMLIHSWDFQKKNWKYEIHIHHMGEFSDDGSFRQYRECVNQIERIERMLKLLWREVKDPSLKKTYQSSEYQAFIDRYHILDQESTAIRESSRIIIRNLLGVGLG